MDHKNDKVQTTYVLRTLQKAGIRHVMCCYNEYIIDSKSISKVHLHVHVEGIIFIN